MESLQKQLVSAILNIYNNALPKKVDVDNFLDIHLPDVNAKKGTHLFFNTAGGSIKLGFYCRDNDFVENAINSSDQIERYSQGIRLLNNPQFASVEDAISNAQSFINIISNNSISNPNLQADTSVSIDNIDLNKLDALFENYSTENDELKSSKSIIVEDNEFDEIEDFNNAIHNYKNQKIEEVAKYVQAGNPVLQFSNDNDVIDNYLISMVSGGNLTQSRLDQYLAKGLDINAATSDDDKYTACHFAAWDGNEEVLSMLIDSGANPDVVGGDGFTPLNLAAANGHLDCVKLLIGNNVNLDNRVLEGNIYHSSKGNIYHSSNGGTPLRDSLFNLLWDVADVLITAGASVSVFNEKSLNGDDFIDVLTQFAKDSEDSKYNLSRLEAIKNLVRGNQAKSGKLSEGIDGESSSSHSGDDSIGLINLIKGLNSKSDDNDNDDDDDDDEEEEYDEDDNKGYPGITVRVRKKDNGEPDEELQAQIRKYLLNWQCPTEAYNGLIGFDGRVPSWIGKIDTPDCCPKFSDQDIEYINNIILKDKIIPVLKYAPDEFYSETKQVWWIVPLSLWAGDKASWLFIDKNGIYAAHPGDDDIAMIYPWDRLEDMEYSTEDSYTDESEVHSLNLTSDAGGELTFVEFVPPGRGSYLSVVKSLYEIRKATIVASKGESQWFEGSGGEGYKSFERPKDLLDSSKWDNPNRPKPSNFGFVENVEKDADATEEDDIETNFQLKDFDISDKSLIDFISNKIQKGKYLTNLLYVNKALENNGFKVDNHQAYFFDSDVLISDRELNGFLVVNMDGISTNCISENELTMIMSWDSVTQLIYSESDGNSSIDFITDQGELTIKKINSYSLKILNTFYISLWKEIIEKFIDEPYIYWNEVPQLGVTEIGFDSIQEYKDFKIK